MISTRRRFKQTMSLHDRLATFAQEARDKAASLPPGYEKQQLLEKAHQAEAASHIDEMINSHGPTPK